MPPKDSSSWVNRTGTRVLVDRSERRKGETDDPSSDRERALQLDGLLRNALGQPLAPGLYIVATPIGNLADLSLRAITTLLRADMVYCEDTRVTQRLLATVGVRRPLKAYHDHNGEAVRPDILDQLGRGQVVALVSDAGTPVISDPGFKLVRDARAAGHAVFAVPGPTAAVAAVSVSGLPSDTVLFLGFLPAKATARKQRLTAVRDVAASLVFYEAPQRLASVLADAHAVLGDRDAVLARELTKAFEETRGGTLAELAHWAGGSSVKGECVVVVGPGVPAERTVTDEDIRIALGAALEHARLADASRATAEQLGVARSRVYEIGLDLKRAREDGQE